MTDPFVADASVAIDAAYLEMAIRRGLKLGCKDGPLRAAATRAGLPLWA